MSKRTTLGVFAAVLALAITQTAIAQFGRGGPSLTPEQRDAAWSLEAEGVAHALKLPDDKTAKLTEAYKAARKSHGEAFAELRETAQPGPGMFQDMQALNEEERKKLRESLSGVISGDDLDTAMALLGTFNNQWDRLANVFGSFDLSDEKKYKGLDLINKYVVDSDAARAEAMAAMDFQSMRETMGTLREELNTAMADVLSAEQFTEWTERTARRGGPGGGRRGPSGGGQTQ